MPLHGIGAPAIVDFCTGCARDWVGVVLHCIVGLLLRTNSALVSAQSNKQEIPSPIMYHSEIHANMPRKDFNFTVLISIDFPNGLCNSDEFREKCQEKESNALDEGWSKLVYCLDSFDYH